MSGDLINIAARLCNTPLLIHPAKAEVLMWLLSERMGATALELDLPEADMSRFFGTSARVNRPEGLSRAHKGVSIIPVEGTLVNRGAWLGSKSGMTSYEGIKAQLMDAAADPEIKSILLDINSPGGEAGGAFDLAAAIRDVRTQKPVVASVNDMSASAAYAIASAADQVVVSPTSVVGSIGVVMTHLDRSGELAQKGIKPTMIYAGAHKVDGHPYGPISENVRSDLQVHVNQIYDQFLNTVAEGRGARFSADQARATEARTFTGTEAVKLGLADRVGTFESVLSELAAANPGRRSATERNGVNHMARTEGAPAAENAGISAEAHEAAVSAARTEAHAAGVAEGAVAERARIQSILTSEAADGRHGQAMALALSTGLSVEEAEKVLAATPKSSGIAARAAALPEIGASAQVEPKAKSASWDNAIERVNKRLG